MVSIIILNYNTFEQTSQCIRSIYEQTKGVDFEIILVDNASTECNPDNFKKLFSEIKLVRNNDNRGFSRGCNDGIKHAKGDYILLLNSDMVLLNDAISNTFNFLAAHPDVGIATCQLQNKDGSPQNNCQRFPSAKLKLAEKLRIHKLFGKRKRGKIWFGPYFNYEEMAYPDWVWGTFFMFPMKLLESFPEKKLTETFWMYVEDMEWCWLTRKAGFKTVFIPEGKVLHFGGGNSVSEKTKKMMDENFNLFEKLYGGK